ncbi:MAG TPA: DMT family transporter [Dongiaceae bacterium]|nr:DMT family transporter [Dongiaceae bacterium]
MPTGLLYVIVVLIWGSSWIGIEYQVGVIPALLSIGYRFFISSGMLVALCLVTGRSLHFPGRDHRWMALQGLSLFCLNYLMFYWSTKYLTSGLIAIVFSTMSVMNLINGAVFLRHRIDRRVALGAGCGLAGLCCVFWPEIAQADTGSKTLAGLGLSLVGTYLASIGNLVSVKLKTRAVPVLQSNAIGMGYGAIAATALSLAGGNDIVFDTRPSYLLSLFLLALFASVIGFSCYLTLVQRIGAGRAAYSAVLFPLVALTISTFLEGYHWTVLAGLGIVLVLCGNVIVLRRGTAAKA